MMEYCWPDPWEQISMRFESKYRNWIKIQKFYTRKWIWKYRLQNVDHLLRSQHVKNRSLWRTLLWSICRLWARSYWDLLQPPSHSTLPASDLDTLKPEQNGCYFADEFSYGSSFNFHWSLFPAIQSLKAVQVFSHFNPVSCWSTG